MSVPEQNGYLLVQLLSLSILFLSFSFFPFPSFLFFPLFFPPFFLSASIKTFLGPMVLWSAIFSTPVANYQEAVDVLNQRFGNKQQIINSHMDSLLQLPAVTSLHDVQSIRQLYNKVESHIRGLKSLGVEYNKARWRCL